MITLDEKGKNCPIPVIDTIKAIEALSEPDSIEVHVDNEVAVQNLLRMATNKGHNASSSQLNNSEYVVTINVEDPDAKTSSDSSGTVPSPDAISTCIDCTDSQGTTLVVISSDTMGNGDEDLGKILIKGYIFALTQLDKLPNVMIFYNGGAKLTVEGSASIDDLKSLEAQGVKIFTCGTCLNHFGITDKLNVGSVTNMYDIANQMATATKIIKPC